MGRGHFPEGLGRGRTSASLAGLGSSESAGPLTEGRLGDCWSVWSGMRGTWRTEMRNVVHFTERNGESENPAGSWTDSSGYK